MAEEMTQTGKQTEALYTIAKMNGYNGPKSSTPLKAFFNSSDALKAKARAVGVALYRGGMVQQKGYAVGGVAAPTPIGTPTDTPHRSISSNQILAHLILTKEDLLRV